MSAVIDFFRSNKGAVVSLAGAVGVLVLAFAMQGCNLGDMMTHRVPKEMRSYTDGEDYVSLNESPFVLEEYMADAQRNIDQYVDANEKSALLFDFINSAVTVGIEEVGNAPIPGATVISGLLLGFAGLMIKKPGTAGAIAKEKMESFNKGQDVALEQFRDMVSPDKLREIVSTLKEGIKE